MQLRHGLRSALRAPGAALLTALLLFLVTTLLGASLGAASSVSRTLTTLSGSYTTIALAEAAGEDAPDAQALAALSAEISALPLPSSVQAWQPDVLAQCMLPPCGDEPGAREAAPYGVLLIRTQPPGVFSSRGTLPAAVDAVLFSTRDMQGKLIEVYWPGLEPGCTCLVWGKWYPGVVGAYACLDILSEPLVIPEGEDPLQTDGAQAFTALAEQLAVCLRSVTAAMPADPEAWFPFQQELVTLSAGRMFTAEELASGARVCLMPEWMAKAEGVAAGQRIRLSLAAGTACPVMESYVPAQGFSISEDYLIVGLLRTKRAWSNTLFLPPQPELAGSSCRDTALLGQFRLNNDGAEAFLLWAGEHLPADVRVTVYDQGYAEAARPIRLMLRAMRLIAAVCALAGAAFLLLSVWLCVSRQRRAGLLMHRMGVSAGGIVCYFVGALLPSGAAAMLAGARFSRYAAGKLTALLAARLNAGTVDLRFSNAHLSTQKSVRLLEQNVPDGFYRLLAGGVLLLAALLCAVLAVRTAVRVSPRARQTARRTRTRTHTLRGGAAKYAALAAGRGGMRTLVSVAAPMLAVILFCALAAVRADTQTQLQRLQTDSTIRGYFTSLEGSVSDSLLLYFSDVHEVSALPQVRGVTVTTGETSVYYIGRLEDGKIRDAFTPPEIPHGVFQASRLTEFYAATLPVMVPASAMDDVPRLMFRGGTEVQWAEGYDAQILRGWQWDEVQACSVSLHIPAAGGESWQEEEENVRVKLYSCAAVLSMERYGAMPCVLSQSFLAEHALALGDEFLLAAGIQRDHTEVWRMKAVGCYAKSVGKETVYVPLFYPTAADERSALLPFGTPQWSKNIRASSAVFRFGCEDLDALRDGLEALGLSEVGQTGRARKPFVLEDQTFLAAKHTIEQRLWYMERTFPLVVVLAEALALMLSVSQILARRRELRLMHCMGTGRLQAFFSVVLEQAALCLPGASAGGALCARLGLPDRAAWLQCAAFIGLWLLGSAAAAGVLVRKPARIIKEG